MESSPQLALGTWPLAGPFINHGRVMGWGDVEEGAAIQTVESAYQLGIEWYDVADAYGLGSALLRLGKALRGVRRSSYKLILKLGYFSPEHQHPYEPEVLQTHFERSLEALRTDYVDI